MVAVWRRRPGTARTSRRIDEPAPKEADFVFALGMTDKEIDKDVCDHFVWTRSFRARKASLLVGAVRRLVLGF